ncbi:MAG TPA: hypothetical protein VF943_11615 [Burkholderiales bacterium]
MARTLALFLSLCSGLAGAAPNEIKVFTDELAAYHAYTLETHVNKARTGPLRVMPEYSYGIWHNWEFSLQLPFAFSSDGSNGEGYRAELQYVAPHDEERGFYWGVNMELARDYRVGEPHFWNVEFIPILGLRVERWHFVANPGFERALSGQERRVSAMPAAKLAYRAFGQNSFGLEYYLEAGPLAHRLMRDEQSRMLYLAWDGKIGKSDINVGLGRGATPASDRWVIKAIYEIAF